MSRALVVAAVGAAVRSALQRWLESAQSGVAGLVTGTEPRSSKPGGAVQLKMMRLTVPAEFRDGPVVRRSMSGELLPVVDGPSGIELEYLAWAQASQPAHEEQLIAAVLDWLRSAALVEVEAGDATLRVMLTPIELSREEVTQLWRALGNGARVLLAFSARAVGPSGRAKGG